MAINFDCVSQRAVQALNTLSLHECTTTICNPIFATTRGMLTLVNDAYGLRRRKTKSNYSYNQALRIAQKYLIVSRRGDTVFVTCQDRMTAQHCLLYAQFRCHPPYCSECIRPSNGVAVQRIADVRFNFIQLVTLYSAFCCNSHRKNASSIWGICRLRNSARRSPFYIVSLISSAYDRGYCVSMKGTLHEKKCVPIKL